ncbi:MULTISPECIES: ABC transporter substrate-binding protein/permease [Helcococcus]|uniref:ABC transporter substrate-binding protein/permease n=1 Tax=Helcococcus bovis TaxID=3153252 RepID=A0ABW9F6S5_9FIRM
MRKRVFTLLLLFVTVLGFIPTINTNASNRKVLRVGMEAAYAPFNWTQKDNSNGAVQIEGSSEYANGYDVQIAKIIANKLGMDVVVVKTEWDGLLPSVQSGKIDAIIAGMSPTAERKKELDFTQNYYESKLILVTKNGGKYSNAKSINDLNGANIVAQLNTFHDTVIDQIPGVNHGKPMTDFSAMRVAVESGKVDAYVAEKPEGVSAENSNKAFKYIELNPGFKTNPEDTSIAIGLKKGSELLAPMNKILAEISSEEKEKIMDNVINIQLGKVPEESIWDIAVNNKASFISGTINTILISLIGTIIGLLIGMLVGIIKTIPKVKNVILNILVNIAKLIANIYVQVTRGTPMMVQAVLFYYGLQLFYNINMSPMASAFIIVSVNTGAYMAEVVRGGINSIDKGQVEAAKALGMNHLQTMIYVILPQVFRNIIPNIGNEFIVNIKDTSVLNVISVQELFFSTKSIAGANFKFFQTYFITSVIYLALTLSITSLLHLLERYLRGNSSYKKIEHDVLSSSN